MKKIVCLLLFLSCFVFANPEGMNVISGSATASHEGNVLNITAGDKSIINWNSFSVGQSEVTNFSMPSSSSAVLNRVTGNMKSEILGSLLSNGKVYLINPAGIIIGSDASVNTAAFIASTYDVLDESFLNEANLLFTGESNEKIVNLGTIKSSEGDVVLIGKFIQNSGKIEAAKGVVSIGAGKEILLKPGEKDGIFIKPDLNDEEDKVTGIENSGTIAATAAYLKADGYMYSLAINNSGQIDALSFEVQEDGQVFLVAEGGRVEMTGSITAVSGNKGGEVRILGQEIGLLNFASIDVSGENGGGEVLLGGDLIEDNPTIYKADAVYFSKDAVVKADSLLEGDGGKVILWSEESTVFLGEISAGAKGFSGNGGFVKIFSDNFLIIQGHVSTISLTGRLGTYFIDPCDITISSGVLGGSSPTYPQPVGSQTYYPTTAAATLTDGDLLEALNHNDVTIGTSAGSGGNGNITINVSLDLSAKNYALTLIADNDIDISSTYTITNGAKALKMTAGRNINIGSCLLLAGGAGEVNLTASGDISVYGLTQAAIISSTSTGNITLQATGNINVGSASCSFSSQIASASTGNISLTAGDTLAVTGGSAANAYSKISGVNGNITIVTPNTSLLGGSADGCYASIFSNGALNNTTLSITPPTGAATGSFILNGGSATNTYAEVSIGSTKGGTVSVTTVGDASIIAGENLGSNAYVTASNSDEDVTVSFKSKDLNITANGSSLAFISAVSTGAGDANVSLEADSLTLVSSIGSRAEIVAESVTAEATVQGAIKNGITIESNGSFAQIYSETGSTDSGNIVFTNTGPITMTSNGTLEGCYIFSTGSLSLAGVTSITMSPLWGPTVIETRNGDDITINSSASPGSGGISLNTSASSNIAVIRTLEGGDINLYFSGDSTIAAGNVSGSNDISCGIMTGYSSGDGDINGVLGDLTIYGGNGSSSGSADAGIFAGYHNLFAGGGNIDLTLASLTMNGGGASNQNAEILSGTGGGTITLECLGEMNLYGGSGQQSSSKIRTLCAAGNNAININSAALALLGGSFLDAAAEISAQSGEIIIGDTTRGMVSLEGGVQTGDTAAIFSGGGYNVEISSSRLTLDGGSGQSSSAEIYTSSADGGSILLYCLGPMTLTGGSNLNSSAKIRTSCVTGDNDITINAASLTLQGGALAGFQSATAEITTESGDITIGSTIRGEISLEGGAGTDDIAIISPGDGNDISIRSNSIDLTGGSGQGAYAAIKTTDGGNLNLNIEEGGLSLFGGTNAGADAFIDIDGTSSIFVDENIKILGENLGAAYIQSNGYNSFYAGWNILIIGNALDQAFIKDLSSQDFTIYSSGSIALANYGRLENAGGDFAIIAGDNIALTAYAKILNGSSSNLTLVADNNYSSYPEFGESYIDISADSLVANTPIGSGEVRIFSVLPQFNTVLAPINGYNFTPGPFLINSSYERWGVYYPDSFFGGPGFTMFYKAKALFDRMVSEAVIFSNSELFFRLNNLKADFYVIDYYDKYIRRTKAFCVGYDAKEYRGLSEYQDCEEYTIYLTFD